MADFTRRDFLRLSAAGLALTLLPAPLARAGGRRVVSRMDFFMGTTVQLSVAGVDEEAARAAMAEALARGRAFAALLTRHEASSPLSTLNSRGRLAVAPSALLEVLRVAGDLHAVSDRVFDVTVLPLLQEEGGRSLEERLALVGMDALHLSGGEVSLGKSGMGVTLDGIAKGYVVDRMSEVLLRRGCPHHLVNAGGDLVVRGDKGDGPWRVAVEDPRKQGRFPVVVSFGQEGAMATSGSYERPSSLPHLTHPRTGALSRMASVTALAPDCCLADGLATALSLMPHREGMACADALPGCACCLVLDDGRRLFSRQWPARLRREFV